VPANIRAVIDTNVFVSGLINPNGPPGRILKAVRLKKFTLITCPEINDEIMDVLNRPHLRDKYGLGELLFDVAFILWELAEPAAHLPPASASSDPDDNKFLSAAVGGKAGYLITGDTRDLLCLKGYQGVHILTPTNFCRTVLEEPHGSR
jgi:putative PIN family toxin of toxin-antitoxin system